jgi:hypothetical protein
MPASSRPSSDILGNELNVKPAFRADPSSPPTIYYLGRLSTSCIFTATFAMYFSKLPVLFLYIRTFGVQKWLRYTCWFLMVFNALGFICVMIYTGVMCSVELNPETPQFLAQCVSITIYTTVSRNALSIAVDLVIFFLPLPIIAKLKLPFYKKLGVSLVFLTGSFALIAGIISLYYQQTRATATSTNIPKAMVATIVECCVAIIVSCAPSLYLFWTHYLRSTRVIQRLGLGGTSTTRTKSFPTNGHGGTTNSSTAPIPVKSDYYIELGDDSHVKPPTYHASASRHMNRHNI